jgi:hypothetical protein
MDYRLNTIDYFSKFSDFVAKLADNLGFDKQGSL